MRYDRYRGSIFSEPFSVDMVERVARLAPKRILETAAGTGALARALAGALPASTIFATDFDPSMIDHAAASARVPNIEWREADAQMLPFRAAEFDAVICQLSVTFFPDKMKAYVEAHRVLKPGGRFIFSVRDRIEENAFAALTSCVVASLFPDDPPSFLWRVPYGYHDIPAIRAALSDAGFLHVEAEVVTKRSRAASPRDVAIAFCHGSLLRGEIEQRNPAFLEPVTDAVAGAIAAKFGPGPIDGKMQAYVITATR